MSGRRTWVIGIGVAAAIAGGAQAQGNRPVPVFINGARMDSDALMVESAGRTLLPMRTLFESLGAQVEWDPGQRAVYAWKQDGAGVRLALGEHTAQTMRMRPDPAPGNWGRVTGTERLDVPPMLVEGRVFVPLRFASEALNADVRFVAARPAVYIQTEQVAGIRQEDVRDLEREAEERRREEARLSEERRLEAARREEERLEAVRREEQRLAEIRAEQERLAEERRREQQRLAEIRAEQERLQEARRRELERREAERLEAERRAAERRPAADHLLSVELEVAGDRFDRDDAVPFRLLLRNETGRRLIVPFATGQQWDVEVLQEGKVIWQWGRDRVFTQARTTLALNPGEEQVFSGRWNLKNNNGRTVTPGRYLIRGIITTSAAGTELVSEQVITVRR